MLFSFRRKNDKIGLHHLSDHELIFEYRQDANPEIISVLFTRYTHLVYGVCLKYLNNKEDARDAVMEIFEALIKNLVEYEIQNFKSWLHSVSRNHCLMILRKNKTIKFEQVLDQENLNRIFVENDDSMHQDIELEEYTLNELELAIGNLKEPQRVCIELVYLKDKSYEEVCEMTGYTVNDVKSHVQNGKRNLRIRLESKNVRKR